MNKTDLIAAVAAKSKLSKAVVGKTLVIGFGTFVTRKREARTGRNPHTGKEMEIAASTAAAFKPGAKLKDAVNG